MPNENVDQTTAIVGIDDPTKPIDQIKGDAPIPAPIEAMCIEGLIIKSHITQNSDSKNESIEKPHGLADHPAHT